MEFSKIGFIGLGLIGGSIAKTIKRIYPDTEMIATAGHRSTVAEAYADHAIKMMICFLSPIFRTAI